MRKAKTIAAEFMITFGIVFLAFNGAYSFATGSFWNIGGACGVVLFRISSYLAGNRTFPPPDTKGWLYAIGTISLTILGFAVGSYTFFASIDLTIASFNLSTPAGVRNLQYRYILALWTACLIGTTFVAYGMKHLLREAKERGAAEYARLRKEREEKDNTKKNPAE